eukprot:6187602-Pleurochrysis_carterae.AAC.7
MYMTFKVSAGKPRISIDRQFGFLLVSGRPETTACRTTTLCTVVLVAYKVARRPKRCHVRVHLTHSKTVLGCLDFGPPDP